MGAYPPTQPPSDKDWRYQRRALRQQAKLQREAFRAQTRAVRRSSVVGPLLLVTIGVITLLAETGRLHWPDLLTQFARWWPLLLVLVGLVRLAEWFLDQRAQADEAPGVFYPRRSLGGGVIVLLILIAAGGIAASAVHSRDAKQLFGRNALWNQDDLDEFLGDKHESDQALTEPLPPGAQITIENPRGDVAINGNSADGQMHLDVHKEIYTRSDSEADSKAHTLVPIVHTIDGRIVVSVPLVDGARTNLTVSVPRSIPVMANVNHGDLHVNAFQSPLMLTANHGDVEVASITGPVEVHVNNSDSSITAHSIIGPLEITGKGKDVTLTEIGGPVSIAGEFFGTTHLGHINSPIRFHTSRTDLQLARLNGELEISSSADLSADQVLGPMVLNTRNRNITLERVTGDLTITNRNGSIDLTQAPPLGNVSIENRNGSVTLTLPTGASFVAQADTTNGDVQDDFSLTTGGSDGHPTLSGSVGQGGPLLRISTSQGDIALKRGSIAPLPPMPPIAPVPHLSALPPDAAAAVRQAQSEARRAMHDAQREAERARREGEEAERRARSGQDDSPK